MATTGVQLKSGTTNIYPVPYFPIGAIYMSTSSTSPASLVGGTWTQLQDRFLIAAGGSYSLGATGGAATVALTTSTIPSHRHGTTAYYGTSSAAAGKFHAMGDGTTTATVTTAAAGSSTVTAHNNMPPYLVVYMWRRTA